MLKAVRRIAENGRAVLALPPGSAAALLAAVLTVTGAFGSFVVVMPLRFAYWLLTLGVSVTALWIARRSAARWISGRFVLGVTAILLAVMPNAVAAGVLASLLGLRTAPGPPAFAVISLSVTPLLYVLWRMIERTEVAATLTRALGGDDELPETLARKLPFRLQSSRLIAIEAQDHYLRVVTDRGEATVHMRLADAVGALEDIDGLQVHRSWWVSASAVQEVRMYNGRGVIVAHHLRIPVSRSFARIVRDRFRVA